MDRQGVRKSLTDLQSVRKSTGVQTTVDITMVMDATGSMQNLMDNVKANALDLHAKIKAALKDKNRLADRIRVKVIAFRDVYVDQVPFIESDFFVLCENGDGDEVQFRDFVSGIHADGGGDEPESALEALHLAINADYSKSLQGAEGASHHRPDDGRIRAQARRQTPQHLHELPSGCSGGSSVPAGGVGIPNGHQGAPPGGLRTQCVSMDVRFDLDGCAVCAVSCRRGHRQPAF